jgi:uncharacterized membrane protein YidH (DUF202 family)
VASPLEPGERPNRTPLDHAPGERYRDATAADVDAQAARGTSGPARGVAWAVLVGIAGAALIVAFGGALGVSLGLVVLAVVIGRFVTLALLAGGGTTISPGARTGVAVGIAILAILLGQLGIWLYARSEGGVLGLLDYLGQAFGWLVPLQLAVAALVAGWTSR